MRELNGILFVIVVAVLYEQIKPRTGAEFVNFAVVMMPMAMITAYVTGEAIRTIFKAMSRGMTRLLARKIGGDTKKDAPKWEPCETNNHPVRNMFEDSNPPSNQTPPDRPT